jgi:SpoVK/Ycf46/Vps4 family AAA+-type ATPase
MARELIPAVIFIDELDSLLGSRSSNENEASRRIKNQVIII